MLVKTNRLNTLFSIVGFLVIISFGVKLMLLIVGVDPQYLSTPHMVNSRVFTARNSQYSILLGGEPRIFAEKNNGHIEEIQTRNEGDFNLSYDQVKSISYIQPFDTFNASAYRSKLHDKKFVKDDYNIRYLAAAQLFCTKKEYKSIIILRVLIMQDSTQNKKAFNTIIDCKDSAKK